MSIEDLLGIILTAVTYYLFSDQFFSFSAKIFDKEINFKKRFLVYLIVYVWFMIASILQLPLIINWLVFLLILGIEIHCLLNLEFLISYALSMFCTIVGLAVNIFFRCLFAIIINAPLDMFDKAITDVKKYPILLGFIVMAIFFLVLRKLKFEKKLKELFQNRKSLLFYVWIEAFIYLFLIVQLLIYTQSDNSIGIKLWGIKSALFSVIILVITNIYSLRVAALHYYMDKQHEMHNNLIQEKKDINKLWKLAYTDVLTACGNRQLLNKRLQEYAGYGGEITIAFIDINSLKKINDQYGHFEGDRYLRTVSKIFLEGIKNLNIDLFRYGGDEFIMMSNTLSIDDISEFLENVNDRLSDNRAGDYKKSISYGIVHGESSDYQNLISEADGLMYQHKLKHYTNTMRALEN